MADYFTSRGGEVRVNSRLQRIDLNADGTVQSFRLADGSAIDGDLYISAMPGTASQCGNCSNGFEEVHGKMHAGRSAVGARSVCSVIMDNQVLNACTRQKATAAHIVEFECVDLTRASSQDKVPGSSAHFKARSDVSFHDKCQYFARHLMFTVWLCLHLQWTL